jgi:hypothetical protein
MLDGVGHGRGRSEMRKVEKMKWGNEKVDNLRSDDEAEKGGV